MPESLIFPNTPFVGGGDIPSELYSRIKNCFEKLGQRMKELTQQKRMNFRTFSFFKPSNLFISIDDAKIVLIKDFDNVSASMPRWNNLNFIGKGDIPINQIRSLLNEQLGWEHFYTVVLPKGYLDLNDDALDLALKKEAERLLMDSQPMFFISHIAGEKNAALWLKETFIKVFGPSISIFCASDRESIPPGEEWYRWITESILAASIVIVLISPKSQHRPWVNFEAGMARGALKKVIPIVYLGAESTGIDFPLSGLQAIMLRDSSDLKQVFEVCESNSNIKCLDMKWDDLFRDFKKIMDDISSRYSTETESQKIQTIHQQTFEDLAEEYTQLIHNLSLKGNDTLLLKMEALVSKMLGRAKKIPKKTHQKIINILVEYRAMYAQHLPIPPLYTGLLGEILVMLGPYVD